MSKAIKEYLLYLAMIAAIGVVFTSIIYNIRFSEFIYRQIVIALAYSIFTILFKKPQYGSLLVNCLLIALPSTIIDTSVLITNPSLVPLRFPFSTVFPILGCLAGYFALQKKYIPVGVLATGLVAFSVISHLFLVPNIVYRMELAKTQQVDPLFLSENFLNRTGDTVSLNTYKTDWLFVDLFFVGCGPCDLKEEMFSELVSEKKSDNYKVIIICNGSISSFESFKKHVSKKPDNPNMVFLYDFKMNISRYFPNVHGYPHEMVLKQGNAYRTYAGFNEESYHVNKTERIKLIESAQ